MLAQPICRQTQRRQGLPNQERSKSELRPIPMHHSFSAKTPLLAQISLPGYLQLPLESQRRQGDCPAATRQERELPTILKTCTEINNLRQSMGLRGTHVEY